MSNNICFIDFETTGIDVFENDPVQFAAVLIDRDLRINKQFTSLIKINTNSVINQRSMHIHGLSTKILRNAPETDVVFKKFFKEMGTNYCLGGWNISFDVPFFKKSIKKAGLEIVGNEIDYRHVDVQTIARVSRMLNLIPQDALSLSDLIDLFGLRRKENHDALEDVILTIKIFKELISLLKTKQDSFHLA